MSLQDEIRRQGRFEYRTVETRTAAGIAEAEALHEDGWKTVRAGLFSTQFVREHPE